MDKLWKKTETTMGNTLETTVEKYGHNYGKHMETSMEK